MAQAPQQNFSMDINKMAAMLPMIPNDEQGKALLAQLTTHPKFGALALTEVAKRDRINTMQAAQNATGGGNIRDALLAKLAADDRFGLNNIVSQAEQGAIDFGGQEPEMAPEMAPPMMAAGGGMIAFENGGRVPRYAAGLAIGPAVAGVAGLAARAAPYASRGVQYLRDIGTAARSLSPRQKMIAGTGLSTAATLPFMYGGEGPEGPPVSDVYPEEFERGARSEEDLNEINKVKDLAEAAKGAKSEKEGAAGIANLLNTDASNVLKEFRRLEKEAGLGEYGASVKEKQAKRRAETEEKLGKEKVVQSLLGAAEAAGAGGKRLEGLGAIAAAVSGGGKGALSVMKEERAAMKELSESEEKLALAEELYKRGEISTAMKMAEENKVRNMEAQFKLAELGERRRYTDAMILAQKAKRGTFKLGDVEKATARLAELQDKLGGLDPKKDAAQIAEYRRLIDMLEGGIALAFAGSGATLTDT